MGVHTWCWKDKDVYKKTLDESLDGYLIEKWETQNEAEFHDIFRCSKKGVWRETITKDNWEEWRAANIDFIYHIDEDRISRFWEKYPNGMITFG